MATSQQNGYNYLLVQLGKKNPIHGEFLKNNHSYGLMGTDNQLIAKQYRVQVHKTLVSSFWVPFRGRMKGHFFSHLYVGPYWLFNDLIVCRTLFSRKNNS